MDEDESDSRMEAALKFVRKRCPNLTESELQEAAENWLSYLDVVWRIAQRQLRDGGDTSESVASVP
jgi:hypothetical protein